MSQSNENPVLENQSPTDLEGLKKLREKFPDSTISTLPKGGASLKYVGHAAVTDRLLEADPLWNWEPLAWDETGQPRFDYNDQGIPNGLWIKLTICGVTRLGYGTHPTGGPDAKKMLISDSLRNAAMRFGVALDCWSKDELESRVIPAGPDWPGLIAGLQELGVTEGQIINKIGRPVKKMTADDYEALTLMGSQVAAGKSIDEVFGAATVKRPVAKVGTPPANPRASVETSIQPAKKTAA